MRAAVRRASAAEDAVIARKERRGRSVIVIRMIYFLSLLVQSLSFDMH